jgi:hypothetical protein
MVRLWMILSTPPLCDAQIKVRYLNKSLSYTRRGIETHGSSRETFLQCSNAGARRCQSRRRPQSLGLVGLLPCEIVIVATKVTISGGLLVDRAM